MKQQQQKQQQVPLYYCGLHQQPCKYFCITQSCNGEKRLACNQCMSGVPHQNHRKIVIKEFYPKLCQYNNFYQTYLCNRNGPNNNLMKQLTQSFEELKELFCQSIDKLLQQYQQFFEKFKSQQNGSGVAVPNKDFSFNSSWFSSSNNSSSSNSNSNNNSVNVNNQALSKQIDPNSFGKIHSKQISQFYEELNSSKREIDFFSAQLKESSIEKEITRHQHIPQKIQTAHQLVEQTIQQLQQIFLQHLEFQQSSPHPQFELQNFRGLLRGPPQRSHCNRINHILQLDSMHFASGSDDRTIKVWHFYHRHKLLRTLTGHNGSVWVLAVLHRNGDGDGNGRGRTINSKKDKGTLLLSGSSDRNIILWNWVKGLKLRVFQGHVKIIRHVCIRNCAEMFTCSDDLSIRLWRSFDGQTLNRWEEAHSTSVTSMVVVNDGKQLLSVGFDCHIRLWAVTPGQKNSSLNCKEYLCECILLASNIVAVSTDSGKVLIFALPELKLIQSMYQSYSNSILGLVQLNQDFLAICSSDNRIVIWKWKCNQQYKVLYNQDSDLSQLACFGKRYLLSGHENFSIKIWE